MWSRVSQKRGLIIPHALTRTVTETDNILFTTLSLNPAKLHLDYESAKTSHFGKPLVNSMYTVSLLVGMSVLETTHGTTIANLGFEEVVFPKPTLVTVGAIHGPSVCVSRCLSVSVAFALCVFMSVCMTESVGTHFCIHS